MSEESIQFTDKFPIRWGDMDAFGHVNNTEYFRYMEQARVNWLFVEKGELFQTDTSSFVVVTANCAFLKPLFFPATLIIESWASDIGTSSVIVHHKIRTEENPNTVFAQGHAKLVCIDLKTQRSTPMTSKMKAYLQGKQE